MGFWEKYKNDYIQIARLGLPILVGQVGMIVVGFADNIMVGRYSTQALASASFVNGVFNTAIFACVGFSYGLTPLVGALFSQGRKTQIGGLVKNGLVVNILFTLMVSLLMGILYMNVDRLDQPEELLPIIRPYFLLYLGGIIPISIFQVFAQWSWGIKKHIDADVDNPRIKYPEYHRQLAADIRKLRHAGAWTSGCRHKHPGSTMALRHSDHRHIPHQEAQP